MSESHPQRTILPILVFSLLGVTAVHFVLRQSLVHTGLALEIRTICDSSSFQLAYTTGIIPGADKFICGPVMFFQTLINPSHHAQPHLAVIFPLVGVLALIPYLEAARDRRPFPLRVPTLFLALSQVASIGVIMPIYALLFITTANTPNPPSNINQGNAEALLFGLLLGYVLPTTLMLYLDNPYMTALWQAFPLLFSLAISAHKRIRPPSRLVHSGHPTVRVTLVFALVVSALLHAIYIWPVLTDSVSLWTVFAPSVGMFDAAGMSLADGVLQFMRWDLIFGAGSVILATLWMAESPLGLLGILVWYSLAMITLGPAAAITGVFLWRERYLSRRQKIK